MSEENNLNSTDGFIPGSGQPWRLQYYINDLQSEDIKGWTIDEESLPVVLGRSKAIVTRDRVYLLGGYSGKEWVPTVYYAYTGRNGELGPWYVDASLPEALGYSSVVVIKNKVYLLGGVNSDWISVPTVYTASISKTGKVWGWSTGAPLPDALSYSSVIATKNRIYLLGGYSGKLVSTIYTTIVNDDGTLGKWTTAASLPEALSSSQVIITKNRVYLLGGFNGIKWVSTVYTASINDNGELGEWSTGEPLPEALGYSSCFVTKGRVYLMGGVNNYLAYVSTVYTAPIRDDGILGKWTIGTPLPSSLVDSSVIATKNRIYLLGGHDDNDWSSTVYTAPISGGLNDYSAYYS